MAISIENNQIKFNNNSVQTTACVNINAMVRSVNGSTGDVNVATYTSLPKKAASGVPIDFTGIPSTARKIIITFDRVSLSSTAFMKILLGTGGVPDTTGYASTSIRTATGSTAGNIWTDGITFNTNSASSILSGQLILFHVGGNTWIHTGAMGDVPVIMPYQNAGYKTLTGVLDIIRITNSATGTNSYDGGQIKVICQ